MKRLLTLCMALTMVFTLSACGGGGNEEVSVEDFKPITLKFSTMNPSEHFSIDAVYRIKDAIEAGTDGKITVDVYPGGQLGNYETVIDEVMRGTIDIAFQSAIDKYDARVAAHGLPYLCTSYDDLAIVYGKDGYLLKVFDEAYADMDVKFLGVYTEGFQGIGATSEIKNAADANAKKAFTVRCPNINCITETFSGMGFNVSTLPYSETLSGIQTGVVDGWVGGTPNVNYLSFRDVIDYYYLYMPYVEATHFIMNKSTFESLPAEYQKVVEDAFTAECEESFITARQMDEESLQLLEEAGIKAITFSEEELKTIASVVRTPVLDNARKLMGDEFIDGLQAFLEENGI